MNNPFLLNAVLCLALLSSAQGGLLHHYNFSSNAPLADDIGGLELATEGQVAFSPEGFAIFDGQGGFLVAEAPSTSVGTYTVSFWFRSDDFRIQDGGPGLLSATSENPFVSGNWHVGLRQGSVNFGGKSLEAGGVVMKLVDKPDPGIWQLITLKFDESGGAGYWINQDPFVPFAPFSKEFEGSPVTFREIRRLVIGSDLGGKNGFFGDIADIRIFDDVEWDDARQSSAYQAGPDLGGSSKPGATR